MEEVLEEVDGEVVVIVILYGMCQEPSKPEKVWRNYNKTQLTRIE